jgi:DNA-binding GntR family transcriptional regulator
MPLTELTDSQFLNSSAAAAAAIRSAILEGELAPGERLKEKDLARRLGISSTPVREALQALDGEGLIELVPNRGAVVRRYTIDDLEELYRLRALLEGYAARRAAGSITAEQLEDLSASCLRFGRLRADGDLRDLVKENLRFHSTILEAAGGSYLTELVHRVLRIPLVYQVYVWYSPEQKAVSEDYHRQLARLLEERDAVRAESVMQEHVLRARDVLIAELRAREGEWSVDSGGTTTTLRDHERAARLRGAMPPRSSPS